MATNTVGIKITAQDNTAGAVRSAVAGMQSLQTAAGGANRVLAGLGVGVSVGAFVAFTKSIIDGVDALNDLKDATGASIENISALEDVARRSGASLDTVGTSLVKLNQALNAAKPGSATEAAVKAIGLSVSELKALDPAEAFRRIAVGLEGFADDANKARLTQELFGKSLKEVAPLLKDLAAQGTLNATVTTAQAEAAEKFNKELFALQKNIADAARMLTGPMVSAINETMEKFREGAKEGRGFYSVIVGEQLRFLGLNDGVKEYADRLTAISEKLQENNLHTTRRASLLREQAALQEKLNKSIKPDMEGDAQSRRMAAPDAPKPKLPDISGGTTKPAGISAAQKLINDGLALYNDLMAESSGYSKTYTEDVTKLAAAYQATSMTAAQYAAALAAINAAQPGAVEAEKARLDAAKLNTQAVDELFDAQEKLRAANEDQIKTGRTMLEQIEYETRLLGLNAEQRAMAALERELETQGIVKGTQAYDAYIAKLREATAIKTAKEAGIESTQALADANKKAAEESSKYWEDALMRAFESGKGFFESLWSTIKNTLKTQVLKVLVTGTIGGLGLTGVANAADNPLGLASTLSSLSNLPTTISNLAGAVTSLPSLLSSSSMGVLDIAGFNPWLAAGAALLAVVTNLGKGETRAGGQYGYSMDGATAFNARRGTSVAANGVGATYLEGPSGGDPYADVASTAINATVQHINDLFQAIGSTSAITAFQAGYETSDKDRGGVFAGGTLTGGIAFGDSGKGDNYAGTLYDSSKGFNLDAKGAIEAFSLDLKQSTIEALQAAQDIPQAIADMIKVDAKALTDEAATALLTSIDALVGDVTLLGTAFEQLPFAELRDLSFDASAGLIKATGSLQALTDSLAGYYQNFYSDAEQTANLTRVLGDTFESLGLSMPVDQLREWYRAQVEAAMAMDQSVPANQAYLAGLLSIQSGVNTLATSAEAAAQRIVDAAAKLMGDIYSAQDDAFAAYLAAQSEYNDMISADQQAAAEAMSAAAEALKDALASAGQGIVQFIQSLLNTPTNAASNYRNDLALARSGDVEASKRLPTSGRAYLDTQINSSATAVEAARATAKMVQELNALPAVKSYEQQLLEAVNATTAAVGGTTTAIDNLDGRITAELSLEARSEILKIINLTVLDNTLTPEQKALALAETAQIDKLIKLSSNNLFSAVDQQLALATTGTVAKTFTAALGAHDFDAMAVAYAQSGTIEKIIRASGGVLTLDQQKLLDGITQYNKDIQIGIKIDSSELTALQNTLMAIFGTIDVTGLAASGVDLSSVISQEALSRLQSVNAYVQSMDWVNTDMATRAAQMHAVRTTAIAYGVSSADVATALGVTKNTLGGWYAALNVPFFAKGTNFIPENTLAMVHEGERIIPAADNRELMSRLQDPQQNSEALVAEIKALRDDNAAQARAMVQLQQRLTKLMERWDSNGLPTERLET
jgi:hypothetical protein